FHLTRERIRQIETQALRKLRLPLRSRRIRAMVERER
ncbi:MAG TPA: sigma factor-like helix-turn-helix DNA-binding protein, partial [Polyangiaceae bacterium]|nr:sigma factor-like helix-turn-helix DNA-binding protein [Polyangiaceae bacterium]